MVLRQPWAEKSGTKRLTTKVLFFSYIQRTTGQIETNSHLSLWSSVYEVSTGEWHRNFAFCNRIGNTFIPGSAIELEIGSKLFWDFFAAFDCRVLECCGRHIGPFRTIAASVLDRHDFLAILNGTETTDGILLSHPEYGFWCVVEFAIDEGHSELGGTWWGWGGQWTHIEDKGAAERQKWIEAEDNEDGKLVVCSETMKWLQLFCSSPDCSDSRKKKNCLANDTTTGEFASDRVITNRTARACCWGSVQFGW